MAPNELISIPTCQSVANLYWDTICFQFKTIKDIKKVGNIV
ncbi:8320_t:CDS:2 [Funneliformis geosporum]|nr:8320_t:CDS:2 [Funneliformis geosporum]